MKKRVVITGIGAITPLGNNISQLWKSITSSQSGISRISSFDPSDMPCQVAGSVKRASSGVENGFSHEDYVSNKDLRRIDDFILFGIAAAAEAMKDSGLLIDSSNEYRAAVIMGSGIGGLQIIEKNSILVKESGWKKISPFFIPAALVNLLSGHIAMKHGVKGPNMSTVSACASGAHAIGEAARMIAVGDVDIAIAGGAESSICPIAIAGFSAGRALSTSFNDSPSRASRPFDRDRDGFVMGEGAGALILESLESAQARKAKIRGEILGYSATGDAYHITAPNPSGESIKMAINDAIQKAQITPDEVDYVNAHATSTPVGDDIELSAVMNIFDLEKRNRPLFMSSVKSSMGHLLGAAGAVELIISLLAIENNMIPPTLNLDNSIVPKDCGIDDVPYVAKQARTEIVLSNSFGFGGTNASIVVKGYG